MAQLFNQFELVGFSCSFYSTFRLICLYCYHVMCARGEEINKWRILSFALRCLKCQDQHISGERKDIIFTVDMKDPSLPGCKD